MIKSKTFTTTLVIAILLGTSASAQKAANAEDFGNTLNLGVGIGYYGYVGHSIGVLHANYEFNAAKNFTLAPFITYYSYQKNQNWGNKNHPDRAYFYRVTTVPVGVKGSYYFDRFLHTNSKWDIYAAGSLGFAVRTTKWETGYNGETSVRNGSSGLYLDLHIGTEYHLNNKLGLYIDFSTGISTLGLAIKS